MKLQSEYVRHINSGGCPWTCEGSACSRQANHMGPCEPSSGLYFPRAQAAAVG